MDRPINKYQSLMNPVHELTKGRQKGKFGCVEELGRGFGGNIIFTIQIKVGYS